MGFGSGVMIGLGIGFIGLAVCLLKLFGGNNDKEWEAYKTGYNDGVNSVKKENE